MTPSKSIVQGEQDAFGDRTTLSSSKHLSADQAQSRPVTSANYLMPSMSEPPPRPYKNSSESLRKNSSTDTEYSLQPYRVIKQSSNETNASFSESINIDQVSPNAPDLSMDVADISCTNIKIIENTPIEDEAKVTATVLPPPPSSNKVTTFGGVEIRQSSSIDYGRSGHPPFLKKQFSIDQTQYTATAKPHPIDEKTTIQKSCLKPGSGTILLNTNTKLISTLQESSSLSTDESKDDRTIPNISTNLVQDEIAKLSSTIKSSTEEEKDPPYNETMC